MRQTLLLITITLTFVNSGFTDYSNKIIASVNRNAITESDLRNLQGKSTNTERQLLIQDLIFNTTIEEESKRLKITVTAEDNKLAPELSNNEILKQKLAKKVFQDQIQVSDQEITEELTNRGLEKDGTKLVNLMQITIDSENNQLAKQIQEAKTAEQFALLGGKIGLISTEDLNPLVIKELDSISPGEVSQGLNSNNKTTYFFLLGQLENKSQIKEHLRRTLAQEKFQTKIVEYFSRDIYKKHQITRF